MAYSKNKTQYPKKTAPKKHHNRKPNWIYPGDLCWLQETQTVVVANGTEGDNDWSAMTCLERVLYTDEPIVYVKRIQNSSGTVVHHIESLGLRYIFEGSIDAFSKNGPVRRPDAWA